MLVDGVVTASEPFTFKQPEALMNVKFWVTTGTPDLGWPEKELQPLVTPWTGTLEAQSLGYIKGRARSGCVA